MGIDLGQAIKINRLRANMTQADLANGIISVSYLSKIENGTAEPPNEVLELLGEKLKLNSDYTGEEITDQSVIQWFQHLLRYEIDDSILLYNKIKNNISNVLDKQMLSLIEIHKLYYYVLINDLVEADSLIVSLQKSSKKFTETEKYYFFKFVGNYHYSKLAYRKALEYYKEAEKYWKSDLFHKSEEIADIFYMIACSASKSRQTHLSLLYSIRALEYYQSNYDLIKSANCHILLGISYRRINDIEKAKESYNYAIKIAKKIGNNEILILCHQNLGKVLSSIGDSAEAINQYLMSYELRKDSSIHRKLTPISSLMQEYYSYGDMENARIWMELGIDLSNGLKPSESIHVYEFKVYQYLINGLNTSFESLITDHIIPFFNERQLHYEESKYIKLIAKYYYDNRKYKLAATYYKKLGNIYFYS
ncbi:helix-turn-helix transcriptional regulator [Paucisalibacillus sp. EB02]|uniref:helix-turn-helix transcriptional regulator n=1 Tax=Paucisalibacillus sp. EB02 TaxID=1347087 RepID=UPI0004B77FCF|nr:helix-turn-helix transcriptional regulator [Paucisalibacillus sp. EB02]